MKPSPKKLAKVIHASIIEHGELSHDDVVSYLEKIDGAYVSESRTGRYTKIAPKILTELRILSGEDIVWCRRSLVWRVRRAGDDPGRVQDE